MKNAQNLDSENKRRKMMPVRLRQAFIGALVCLLLANLLVPFPMLRSRAEALDDPDAAADIGITEEEEESVDYILGRPMTDDEIEAQKEAIKDIKLGRREAVDPSKEVPLVDKGLLPNNAKVIPSSYDLRDTNRVTSVKYQNPYGACWTFAAINSVESSLISRRKADNSINLSEKHLAYFTYNANRDKLGNTVGDSIRAIQDNYLDIGGNDDLAANTLIAQLGAVVESDMPYSNSYNYSDIDAEINAHYDDELGWNMNDYVVNSVKSISLSDTDYVKQGLMQYGSASISIFWPDYTNINIDDYYNWDTAALYNSDYNDTNHAVSLVGWDDDYSRTNFTTKHRPKNNGAWLIKNSWDTWFGDEGYFWVSYEDKAFVGENVYFFCATDASDYSNIYQYDGAIDGSRRYLSANSSAASVFRAAQSENISSVIVGTDSVNSEISVKVYNNVTDISDPASGTLAAETQATILTGGYTLVDLPHPVSVTKNSYFSVVVTSLSGDFYIYQETNYNGWFKSVASQNPNECLYGRIGSSWTSSNYGIGIKAFATTRTPVSATGISLNMNSASAYCGDTIQLIATVTPATSTDEVIWEVTRNGEDASDVCLISEGGYVTPLEGGVFVITATAGSKVASCTLTVIRPTEGIVFDPASVNMAALQTRALEPIFVPDDHTDSPVIDSWTSSNVKVATVDENGVVTALSKGTAVITATSGEITGTCKINVTSSKVDVKSVVVAPKTQELIAGYIDPDNSYPVGGEVQLKATVSPANATLNEVSWSTDDPDVAVVTETGMVYAVAPGTATITATADGKTGVCAVTVYTEGGYLAAHASPITPGRNYAVNRTSGEKPVWFSYTPTEDGYFNFLTKPMAGSVYLPIIRAYEVVESSEGWDDPTYFNGLSYVGVNSRDGYMIGSDDQNTCGRLTAGTTYLFGALSYVGETSSYYVRLDEVSGVDSISFVGAVDPLNIAYTDGAGSYYCGLYPSVLDGSTVRFTMTDGTTQDFTVTDGYAGKLPICIDIPYDVDYDDNFESRSVIFRYDPVDVSEDMFSDESDRWYDGEIMFLKTGSYTFSAAVGGNEFATVPVNVSADDIGGGDIELDKELWIHTGSAITPGVVSVAKKFADYEEASWMHDEKGNTTTFHLHTRVFLNYNSSEYSVGYSDNVDVGTGKVTVTGSGTVLTGSKDVSFKILPEYDPANDREEDYWYYDEATGEWYPVLIHVVESEEPAMLSITEKKATTVKLEWNEVDGAEDYYILRSDLEDDPDSYEEIAKVTAGVTEYTDDALTYNKPYSYKVTAQCTEYCSETEAIEINVTSNAVAVIPDMDAPVLTAASASFNSVKLTWNKIDGANGYEIWLKDGDADATLVKKVGAGTVTATITKLVTGQEYTYIVRPYKTINKAPYYSVDSNTATVAPVPATPAAPVVTPNLKLQNIKVAWKAVAGASGYILERSESVTGPFEQIGGVFTNKMISYVDTPGQGRYYYRVTAYTTVNGSDVPGRTSSIVSGTLTMQVPAAKVTASTYNSVKLGWDKIPAAAGYEVWCSFAGEGYKLIATLKGSGKNTYNHTKLATGSKYSYKVRSYAANGDRSEFSDIVSATPTIAAPAKITAARSGFNLKISWSASAGAQKYELYRSVDGGTYKLLTTTKAKSFIDKQVSRGVLYSYKVKAVGTVKSSFSSVVKATPTLAAPGGFAAKAPNYYSVQLTWKKSAGADGYAIYRSLTKDGVYRRIDTVWGNANVKWFDYDVDAGTTYYYVVKAMRYTDDGYNYYTGYSNCTPIKSAMPQLPAPAKPKAVKYAPGEARLTWNYVDGAVGYSIYRCDPGQKNFEYVGSTDELSYVDSGLLTGKAYKYKVRAYWNDPQSETEGKFSGVLSAKV